MTSSSVRGFDPVPNIVKQEAYEFSEPCRFWSGSGPLIFFKKKSQNGEDGVL